MFDTLVGIFRKKLVAVGDDTSSDKSGLSAAVGDSTRPDESVLYRAWVLMKDGRVGYIDHYKSDGKFGVRPVMFETGLHYPNTSKHWTNEKRLANPEELALTLSDFVAAPLHLIPAEYRTVIAAMLSQTTNLN